jgi:hypothetical protein
VYAWSKGASRVRIDVEHQYVKADLKSHRYVDHQYVRGNAKVRNVVIPEYTPRAIYAVHTQATAYEKNITIANIVVDAYERNQTYVVRSVAPVFEALTQTFRRVDVAYTKFDPNCRDVPAQYDKWIRQIRSIPIPQALRTVVINDSGAGPVVQQNLFTTAAAAIAAGIAAGYANAESYSFTTVVSSGGVFTPTVSYSWTVPPDVPSRICIVENPVVNFPIPGGWFVSGG